MENILSNRIILVVDDDDVVRKEVSEYFANSCNSKVIQACNGKDGVNKFKEHGGIDIVLTDLQMSPMNGLEMIQAIKDEFPSTQAIFSILSTEKGKEHRDLTRSLGIAIWKLKPFEGASLEKAYSVLLNRAK